MPKLVGIDQSKAKQTVHDKCGAIIEYFLKEVKNTSDYDSPYIICPKCKERVCVKGY